MKFQQIAIVAAISAALASPMAMAEKVRLDRHARHSITADVTRTTGNGKTMSRHTEQAVTETGFRRESTMTSPEGKTASRIVEGSRDPDTHTYTKTVQGTRMNGDTYSAERVTQKTEDGYNRSVSRTNAAGETASKQVNTVVDRENHTITKNITGNGFNGEVHTATVVKTYNASDME